MTRSRERIALDMACRELLRARDAIAGVERILCELGIAASFEQKKSAQAPDSKTVIIGPFPPITPEALAEAIAALIKEENFVLVDPPGRKD